MKMGWAQLQVAGEQWETFYAVSSHSPVKECLENLILFCLRRKTTFLACNTGGKLPIIERLSLRFYYWLGCNRAYFFWKPQMTAGVIIGQYDDRVIQDTLHFEE